MASRWKRKKELPLFSEANGHASAINGTEAATAPPLVIDPVMPQAESVIDVYREIAAKEQAAKAPAPASPTPRPGPGDEIDTQHMPPAQKDVLFIVNPTANQRIKFRCDSVSFWGVWTHYTPGKTVLCYKRRELCEGGHKEINRRWKGYLQGWSTEREEEVFFQFTPRAAKKLIMSMAPKTPLRGLTFEIWRTGAKKGRVLGRWLSDVARAAELDALPAVLDPRRSIYNFLKIPFIPEMLSAQLCGDAGDIPDEEN